MSELARRFTLIQGVEREYQQAAIALDLLYREAEQQTDFAQRNHVNAKSIMQTKQNLERTYVVRICAELESALRAYWREWRGRISDPPTRDLIESLTPNFTREDWIRKIHEVRVFRNALVHDEADTEHELSLSQCRARICRFLSLLNANW